MVLSGTIRYKILPSWMYHAQLTQNVPGLTWVDLVFPLFLFSMGAAIPLALSRRIDNGNSPAQIIFYILKRGFFLAAFAILLQHLRPQVINPTLAQDMPEWWIGILGFFLLFLIFVQFPESWKISKYDKLIKLGAWVATITLISQLQYPNGIGFSLDRSDPILLVLANMAVWGSIIWLFTKSNVLLRLGFIGFLLAMKLSATSNGWIASIWSKFLIPGIFQLDFLKYLFIVIPGTIAGDLILSWLEASSSEEDDDSEVVAWEIGRFYLIILLMAVVCLLLLVGLQSRLVWQTTLGTLLLCLLGGGLFIRPKTSTEELITYFYKWGFYWLILGLLFEPFGGGIKKDPATISYYFITTGIAFFSLIIFTIIIDIFKQLKPLQLLIDNGLNPMIGYVGFANLLWPILNLTGLEEVIINKTNHPFMGFMKGVVSMLLIAYVASLFTKKKLFWKT